MRNFNLSAWAVTHKSLVGFLIALLFAAGGISYNKLGRAEDPGFTIKVMVVSAEWPGATADEMQEQVAERLERKLQDLAYLDHLTTFVRPGVAAIMVAFRDDTPPSMVPDLFYQTRKKLDDIKPDLPRGVIGPAADDEYSDVYGAAFALTSPDGGADNAELVRQAEHVRDQLLTVPGAEKVIVTGETPRDLFVEFSHSRLSTLGFTVQDVMQSIAKQNVVTAAGLVETNTTRVPIRVDGAIAGAHSLADVPVTAPSGAGGAKSLRLGDIATIRRGYQDPPAFEVRHNGLPAVVVAVSMQKGVNGMDFGRALHAEAARISASLPAGIEMQQIADQPKIVGQEVNEFLLKFAIALAVVLLVSFLSLGLRVGIVVALAVPLTLALVFVVMNLLGIELQRISLGALILALGLLVDDAIIAIETMVVKLEEGMDRLHAATFAWTSTAFPMLTGTLVTAAGFLPVALAKSTSGEYAGGIFWVVGLALIASWVVAVVFTPYLGVLLLPAPRLGMRHDEMYATRPYRALRRMVRGALRHRKAVILATALMLVGAGFGMIHVRQQFFPRSERPELVVDMSLRQGASHEATSAAVAKLEHVLEGDKDVRWYTSYIGGGPPRFFLAYNPALPNDSIATIILTAKDAAARDRIRDRLREVAASNAIPEASFRAAPLELGPPVGFPVQFRVVGTDIAAVRHAADEVLDVLRNTPGTRDAQLAWGDRAASMRLELDQARIRQLGLAPADIAETLQTLLSGTVATSLRDGTKLIDVVLRAVPSERLDLSKLPDMTIAAPAGPVALSQIARLVPQTEEPILWRRDRMPFLTVEAEVQDGLQAPDVTAAALTRVGSIALPSGVRIETGGAAEESAKANKALYAVIPIMVAAMLTLLMIQLQNIGRALLVMATAPLGVIGAVAALLLGNAPFGFVALLGLISLAGMIMRNSVILVDQVRQDLEFGRDLRDAIIESTVRRARPVVLTALASALAFVPLATNTFWGPMALVMIGGLAGATLLTLVFLPALYAQVAGVDYDRVPAPTKWREISAESAHAD